MTRSARDKYGSTETLLIFWFVFRRTFGTKKVLIIIKDRSNFYVKVDDHLEVRLNILKLLLATLTAGL